jgi:hypothetical protein
MNRQRTMGVREARVGLSLLTGALLMFGYFVLHRFGGAVPNPPVEFRTAQPSDLDGAATGRPMEGPDTPRILRAQEDKSPESAAIHTSQRPEWALPMTIDGRDGFGAPDSELFWPTLPGGLGERSRYGESVPR